MLVGKVVVIVSPNRLLGLGLKSLLSEYFSPARVVIAPTLASESLVKSADYLFVNPDTFTLHHAQLVGHSGKAIIFSEKDPGPDSSLPAVVNVNSEAGEIVERLRRIFTEDLKRKRRQGQTRLTSREIDVLKLVALGNANKRIADQLSISMHTVISHRKNLTRKLGIKTVSGLTMYAVLNGLVALKDVH